MANMIEQSEQSDAVVAPPRESPLVQNVADGEPASSRRTGRWLKLGGISFVIIVVVTVAAVMSLRSSKPAAGMLTHVVQRGELVVSVTERGTLESSNNKEIKCRVKGGTTVLWVIKTGTRVKPGDVLVRLDTSKIEDDISQRKIDLATARANKRIAESEVAAAEIAVTEYLEGTYESELATKQKELVIAESELKAARNSLDHSKRLFRKGYISRLEYEAQLDAVKHAELGVHVKETEINALKRFTKAKTMKELQGKLDAAKARLDAYASEFKLQESKLRRAEDQLKNCIIRADTEGLVIYPSAAEWRSEPDIAEGATVREDQVLLMIPDLSKMQVKIGVHESKVDRVKPGKAARVDIQGKWCDGKVKSVASVTRPTGWWNGNMVRYDTVIELNEGHPPVKPGMSVAVEVLLAKYEDVLTVPVAAVVATDDGALCWIDSPEGPVRRKVTLGDTNDQFVIVESGITEGEAVILNPGDLIEDAAAIVRKVVPEDRGEQRREPAGKNDTT